MAVNQALENFLTAQLAHWRYGEKPNKAQQAAARTLANACMRKLAELPAEPVLKTRVKRRRQTR